MISTGLPIDELYKYAMVWPPNSLNLMIISERSPSVAVCFPQPFRFLHRWGTSTAAAPSF